MNDLVWILLQYVIVVFIAATGAIVLIKIFSGAINLNTLLSEADGKASLSRFQLLLFTFAIVGIYVALCFQEGELLELPNGVLGLLGISGGSFILSKGIQQQTDKHKIDKGQAVPPNPHTPVPPPSGAPKTTG